MRGPMMIGDVVRAARRAIGGLVAEDSPRPRLCFSCRAESVGVRPGMCERCRRQVERERAHMIAERILIPPRFRWARLDRVHFAPAPELSPAPPWAVEKVRAFDGSLLVLRGGTDTYKTSLAAARLLHEGEAGRSAIMVLCEDLAPDARDQDRAHALLVRAAQEQVVLLDDLGQDLSGAPAGGGLASFRGARARRLIRQMHNDIGIGGRRRTLMVTTGLTDDQISAAYGDDIARRLLGDSPGTMVISL